MNGLPRLRSVVAACHRKAAAHEKDLSARSLHRTQKQRPNSCWSDRNQASSDSQKGNSRDKHLVTSKKYYILSAGVVNLCKG